MQDERYTTESKLFVTATIAESGSPVIRHDNTLLLSNLIGLPVESARPRNDATPIFPIGRCGLGLRLKLAVNEKEENANY